MMGQLVVETVKRVTLTYTADQWALYDNSQEGYTTRAREECALELNNMLVRCVNWGHSRMYTQIHMQEVFERWAFLGATDTAVSEILSALLDTVYGEN
jgi:L-fucose isomerase-like protein